MNYPRLIEEKLTSYIPENTLAKSVRYSLLGGGKRFRGSLCYLVADMFQVDNELVHSSSCALEMIHAYSLIHDDLPAMDNDDIRRGKVTNHIQFNDATAILTGDGLQSLAFKIITDDDNLDSDTKIKLIQTLTTASFDMVLGQKLDIESNNTTTLTELEHINALKTGALLNASVIMGGIIAKVDDTTSEILVKFANNLAKAYQVQDDTFDGKNEMEIGKTNNSNTLTFVSVMGRDEAKKYYTQLYDNALIEIKKIPHSRELQELVTIMKLRKF